MSDRKSCFHGHGSWRYFHYSLMVYYHRNYHEPHPTREVGGSCSTSVDFVMEDRALDDTCTSPWNVLWNSMEVEQLPWKHMITSIEAISISKIILRNRVFFGASRAPFIVKSSEFRMKHCYSGADFDSTYACWFLLRCLRFLGGLDIFEVICIGCQFIFFAVSGGCWQ